MRWLIPLAFVGLVGACRLRFDADPTVDASAMDTGPDADVPPTPTCTGHDEDGDGFPDACDVCPTIPDPFQRDRGELLAGNAADGVGDACDPRPSLDGDYIEVFDPHTSSGTTTYYNLNGTVSWPGEALRLGGVGTFAQADYVLPVAATRLEMRVHVVAASPTTTQWMGIWYTDNASDNRRAFAQAADTPNDANDVELNIKQDDMATVTFSPYVHASPQFSPGDTYTFVVETALANGTEDVLRMSTPVGDQMTSYALTIPRDRFGFLEAAEMSIDVDYFIAYAIR